LRKANPDATRLLVFDLLSQVNREGAYANIRLPDLLGKSKLNSKDRNLATEMAYGTLRMQGLLDHIAGKFTDRPFNELDPKIQDLLRMGIYQLTQMRIPDHAAVGETVEVARMVAGDSKSSYVNAILRKVSAAEVLNTELDSLPIVEKLSIKYSHPIWIVNAFYDQLKNWESVEQLLAADNQPTRPDLVAWPTKSTEAEFLDKGAQKIEKIKNGFTIEGIPSDFIPVIERRAGVQDRGSQIVVEDFLATWKPGLKWLDMCAGPGGKAAYLYYSLKSLEDNVDFLANEPVPHRAELVKRVIGNEIVTSFDGTKSESFGGKFDRILVDAPCTGLGALRRRPEARWRKKPSDLKELVSIQHQLLESAYRLLLPFGIIAYVTCSPHISETRAQVANFLADHDDMKILNISSLVEANRSGINPDGTVQLWTHLDQSDSMFIAFLQKID
jgi:16S rRNA (cytosine967-C5)-methyltransferase